MSNLARQLEKKRMLEIPDHQKQVHPETSRKRCITSGERFLCFTTILCVVFASFLIISNYASIYIVNKNIHTLQNSIDTQMINNEALQLQVTELSAPDRILGIATEELGMTLNDKNVKVVRN